MELLGRTKGILFSLIIMIMENRLTPKPHHLFFNAWTECKPPSPKVPRC